MQGKDEAGILSDYWDEDECAAELNVAALTLKRWRPQKKGPPVTYIGRTPYYKKTSVKAWVAAQERPAERLPQNRKSAIA